LAKKYVFIDINIRKTADCILQAAAVPPTAKNGKKHNSKVDYFAVFCYNSAVILATLMTDGTVEHHTE